MSKKIGKIKLHWAEKFRELAKKHNNNAKLVCVDFLVYCNAEELAITRKFSADRDECRKVRER